MREIKFRVWDEDKMINLRDAYDRDLISFSRVIDNYMRSEFEGVELLQYTGLKDKNGKEIYEGDILSYSTKVKQNGKVQFNSNKAQFEVIWALGDINTLDKHWTENELEVIGNIYEEKHLLNN